MLFTKEELEALEWFMDNNIVNIENDNEHKKTLNDLYRRIERELYFNKYCKLKKINVFTNSGYEDIYLINDMLNTYMYNICTVESYRDLCSNLKNDKYKDYNIYVIGEKMFAHCNPKKQVDLIKMIIRKIKDKDIKLLISCKNPYILYAIETYSVFYNLKDDCRIYYVDKNQKINNITTCTDYIYEEFSQPLQDLDRLNYDLLNKEDN